MLSNKGSVESFSRGCRLCHLVQLNHVIDSCGVCGCVFSCFSSSSSWVTLVLYLDSFFNLCILGSSLSKVMGGVFVLHFKEQIQILQWGSPHTVHVSDIVHVNGCKLH